jgi:hypothetical protein
MAPWSIGCHRPGDQISLLALFLVDSGPGCNPGNHTWNQEAASKARSDEARSNGRTPKEFRLTRMERMQSCWPGICNFVDT